MSIRSQPLNKHFQSGPAKYVVCIVSRVTTNMTRDTAPSVRRPTTWYYAIQCLHQITVVLHAFASFLSPSAGKCQDAYILKSGVTGTNHQVHRRLTSATLSEYAYTSGLPLSWSMRGRDRMLKLRHRGRQQCPRTTIVMHRIVQTRSRGHPERHKAVRLTKDGIPEVSSEYYGTSRVLIQSQYSPVLIDW